MKKSIYLIAIVAFTSGGIFTGNTLLNESNDFALTGLVKTAYAYGEYNTPKKYGRKCDKDECEVSYSVGIYTVTEKGHYWHCKTTTNKRETCNPSTCDIKCDAI